MPHRDATPRTLAIDLVRHPFAALHREIDRVFGDVVQMFDSTTSELLANAVMTPEVDVPRSDSLYMISFEGPEGADPDPEIVASNDLVTTGDE